MATERQIAANRRNAHKSTGPRSHAGKQRVSRNAYRHGLTLSVYASEDMTKQIDDLMREIIGDVGDGLCRQLARAVAEGHFDLARIRRTKVALIESNKALAPTSKGPINSEEAILRAVPDLVRLDRYERRAISRRDGAVRKLRERRRILELI